MSAVRKLFRAASTPRKSASSCEPSTVTSAPAGGRIRAGRKCSGCCVPSAGASSALRPTIAPPPLARQRGRVARNPTFNQQEKTMRKIAVVNESTLIGSDDMTRCVAALQTQVSRDFASTWGIDASLRVTDEPDDDEELLVLFDDAAQA